MKVSWFCFFVSWMIHCSEWNEIIFYLNAKRHGTCTWKMKQMNENDVYWFAISMYGRVSVYLSNWQLKGMHRYLFGLQWTMPFWNNGILCHQLFSIQKYYLYYRAIVVSWNDSFEARMFIYIDCPLYFMK